MCAKHVPWVLRVLLVLASVLSLDTAAHAGDGLLQIPVRWYAIKGSPTADNPASLGEPDTDNVLWRRHERASDQIWIPAPISRFGARSPTRSYKTRAFPSLTTRTRHRPNPAHRADPACWAISSIRIWATRANGRRRRPPARRRGTRGFPDRQRCGGRS